MFLMTAILFSVLVAPRAAAEAKAGAEPQSTTGNRRYHIYSPELNLISEIDRDPHPAVTTRGEFIWFGGQPVAQVDTIGNKIAEFARPTLREPRHGDGCGAEIACFGYSVDVSACRASGPAREPR